MLNVRHKLKGLDYNERDDPSADPKLKSNMARTVQRVRARKRPKQQETQDEAEMQRLLLQETLGRQMIGGETLGQETLEQEQLHPRQENHMSQVNQESLGQEANRPYIQQGAEAQHLLLGQGTGWLGINIDQQ